MEDYKNMTVGITADNMTVEAILGYESLTFSTWGNKATKVLDGVEISFDEAQQLAKIINKTISAYKAAEKKYGEDLGIS